MNIGWLMLIFAAAIALVAVGGNAYYRMITGRVRAKLDEIAAIYENGQPPWRDDGACGAADIERLSRLIRYTKQTRLVVDEQTRGEVLERLEEVLTEWSRRAGRNETDTN